MSLSSKQIFIGMGAALVCLMVFTIFSKQYGHAPEIVFSEFTAAVERGDVREVMIQGQNIQGKYRNGEEFKTFAPDDPDLMKSLREKKVKIAAKPDDDSPWYMVLADLVSHAADDRRVGLFHAPDAGGWRQGDVLRQEPRQAAYGEPASGDF